MTKTPKYAPAREDGLKPWLVTITQFGRSYAQIIYADTRGAAEFEGKGQMLYTYARARRATPADVDRLAS